MQILTQAGALRTYFSNQQSTVELVLRAYKKAKDYLEIKCFLNVNLAQYQHYKRENPVSNQQCCSTKEKKRKESSERRMELAQEQAGVSGRSRN